MALLQQKGVYKNGSGGSRLIAGNYPLIEEAERQIADYHGAEAGLIYNSGYDANLGFFSCIARRGDTILYDALSHASIRDGIRLSNARSLSFAHNDLQALEDKLGRSEGEKFVVVESIYSMDGDAAPLQELAALCYRYQAYLVVDEAHSTGIFGQGKGLVSVLGLEDKVFARLHTFGKAMGCHGAIWLGSSGLRNYLVNYSRSFIYTTALPPHSVAIAMAAYRHLQQSPVEIEKLFDNIGLFRQLTAEVASHFIASGSPIQSWIIPGNEAVMRMAETLRQKGFDVKAIRYPTVPEGSERIRIVLHSFNTAEEIATLSETICSTTAGK